MSVRSSNQERCRQRAFASVLSRRAGRSAFWRLEDVRSLSALGGVGPPAAIFYDSRIARANIPRRIWPDMLASAGRRL